MQVEFYALLTSFCFGLNAILIRKGLKDSTPVTAAIIVSLVQTPILAVLALRLPIIWDWQAVWYFVLAGIFASTIARALNYIAIDRVGVNVATSLSGTDPLFSNVLAIVILGEPMVPSTLAGVVLIVLGVLVMSGFELEEGVKKTDIILPILAAFGYASANMVRKIGMSITPNAGFGAVIGSITSIIVFPLYLASRGRLREFNPRTNGLKFFVGGGVVVSVAMLSMYTAFQSGSIAVVTGLIGAAPLFGLVLTALLLKDTERITRRVVAGCITIFLGVLLITVF
ncbi:DMT family transporter [Candidatus Bathyarchaeota archaeon]|nr:DMT family transporter [Candidatus Bathyarchaeota archaeon]